MIKHQRFAYGTFIMPMHHVVRDRYCVLRSKVVYVMLLTRQCVRHAASVHCSVCVHRAHDHAPVLCLRHVHHAGAPHVGEADQDA